MGTPTRAETFRRAAASVGRNVLLYAAVIGGVLVALWGLDAASTLLHR